MLLPWPKENKLEGKTEIYLGWKNLAGTALAMLVPLIIALLFQSLIIKVVCWSFFFLLYITYLRSWGPCVMAIAVGVLPWYVFFEWKSSPTWLAIIAVIITLIEISYIRHRMGFLDDLRKKENIILP